MRILGIETSCDETAAAVVESDGQNFIVTSSVVSSQIKLHAEWGGVVPNLAAREHLKNVLPVINRALTQANISLSDIDAISVTNGPGLIPALLIGTGTAKTLAYFWKKPLLPIHHIEGHIYANFISAKPVFPLLCLVVSGGHTQLVLMKKHFDYEIIGQTLDDAAGEAFDKVARILGLGYPGGPSIAKLAAEAGVTFAAPNHTLPRPMLRSKNFNFSFSGLKTAVLYLVKNDPSILEDKLRIADLCREFQQAVIDVLIHKTLGAAKKYSPRQIMLAGGVSANKELAKQMVEAVEKSGLPETHFLAPDTKYSLDNAAMIAIAGAFHFSELDAENSAKTKENWKYLTTDANLKLSR